mmetsp:Transcript_34120/g.88055  ORF Transcript_34120/g.88055 Transcript_34120/m.88055 type:complete len:484 (+) Transcript_34120:102-1553(+)
MESEPSTAPARFGRADLPSAKESQHSITSVLLSNLPLSLDEAGITAAVKGIGKDIKVRKWKTGKLRRCALLSTPSLAVATRLVRCLNGSRLHGRKLKVEYLHSKEGGDLLEDGNKDESQIGSSEERGDRQGEAEEYAPLNPHLDLHYPLNPSLHYLYPPPTPHILSNIAAALMASPRFYTQVLHLMNKMCLPPPFGPELAPNSPSPSCLFEGGYRIERGRAAAKDEDSDEGKDEEEIMQALDEEGKQKVRAALANLPAEVGNTGEGVNRKKRKTVSVVLRKDKKKKKQSKKEGKGEGEEEGEKEGGVPPSHQVKGNEDGMEERAGVISTGSSTAAPPTSPPQSLSSKEEEGKSRGENKQENFGVSAVYLDANRLPPDEIASNAKFTSKYKQGDPSCVLYVRNLSKAVDEEDLLALFGRHYASAEEASKKLKIKHMKEGRMRGQAFITYPTVEEARVSLLDAHALVYKEKPLIVMFGKGEGTSN